MLDLNPADDLPIEELSLDPVQGSTVQPQHDQIAGNGPTPSVGLPVMIAAGILILILWGATRLLR
ncbi:MAG TPA: hypothetical protein VGY31_03485 [Terriglobia bacterium]|nr:hypothetical protein [Terriglobia bacterium]